MIYCQRYFRVEWALTMRRLILKGDLFQDMHGQWAVVTYIFVLETNTGATIRTGALRFIGTIVGALYAYIVSSTSSLMQNFMLTSNSGEILP